MWCLMLKWSSADLRKICVATNVTITNNMKMGKSSRRANGKENRQTTVESMGKTTAAAMTLRVMWFTVNHEIPKNGPGVVMANMALCLFLYLASLLSLSQAMLSIAKSPGYEE
jgi:hypothetical protein